jgi:hypothetical protein
VLYLPLGELLGRHITFMTETQLYKKVINKEVVYKEVIYKELANLAFMHKEMLNKKRPKISCMKQQHNL